jgi:ribosomal protein S18 acetylase RimI-like enzyme
MSLSHYAGEVAVERLGPENLVETFGFLDRDPILNVYLIALALRDTLARARDEFWAARRDGEIVGLLHLGGQSGAVLPIGEDAEGLEAMAARAEERLSFVPRRFQVIGPRPAVRAITTRLEGRHMTPRLYRDQIYMSLDRESLPPFAPLPELRRAGRDDFDLLYEAGALLRLEELEEDPREVDPIGYRNRVEEECRDGYTHLWIDGGGFCFRASVSACTPDAAQVSGVYTPPARRNRGIARRALSEMCTRLFEKSRHICLFVNEQNAPAIAVYRRMGFRSRSDWASAFYDLPR